MALKAIHVANVPNFDYTNLNVSDDDDNNNNNSTINLSSAIISPGTMEKDGEGKRRMYKIPKFMVMGHRGSGMNVLQSSDPRMKGVLSEKRLTEITLEEFMSYGPQNEPKKVGKPMFRRAKDGSLYEWKVEKDSPLCTLQEVFEKVDKSLGFNIELKIDDNKKYDEAELKRIMLAVMKIVDQYAGQGRQIFFSTFIPDAAKMIRRVQNNYPVFFLTNGGCEIYADPRRNSFEEVIKLCLEAGLHGIVSQVRAIFRHPSMVSRIKESKLSLIIYGQLDNVPEVVYMQHLMGVEGVIIDFVQEIKEAVSDFSKTSSEETKENTSSMEEIKSERVPVKFSDRELSFLLKLIPELVQT